MLTAVGRYVDEYTHAAVARSVRASFHRPIIRVGHTIEGDGPTLRRLIVSSREFNVARRSSAAAASIARAV